MGWIAMPSTLMQADSLVENDILPIKFQEHAQLQSLGINAASIGFNTLTLESDKYICVREKTGDQNHVVVIDLGDTENIIRRPISAESAIMNPNRKIIALKAGVQLQVFDLDEKRKLCSTQLQEEVCFWKWISNNMIGLVTTTSVFHWDIDGGDKAPTKMFDRHASLSGCQIINYRVDSSVKWLLLVGISAHQGRVSGSMQLHNIDKNISQPIEGHIGTFAEVNIDLSTTKTKVFAFAVRTANSAKLHLVEIDHVDGAPTFSKKAIDIFFPPEASNDFPVSLQASEKYGLLYLVTKYGFIHIYEIESGECIFMNRISSDTIFVTAEYRPASGIIGVNRKGQVLSVSIDENTIVPYILQKLNMPDIAIRLSYKSNLSGASELFVTKFSQLLQEEKYTEAAKIAAFSPNGVLRTKKTIESLKGLPIGAGEMSPLLQYFGILLEQSSLNNYETLELARPVLAQGKTSLLEKWLKENKLQCSLELGDIIRPYDVTLALSVYLRADIPEKVCECFAELGQFSKILLFAKKVNFEPNLVQLLQTAINKDPAKAVEFAKLILEEDNILETSNKIFELFAAQGLVQQATAFIIDKLKTDTSELAELQTKVLALNIKLCPQVADAIIKSKIFTKFDRQSIAKLCESAGLFQRALELYSSVEEITNTIMNGEFPTEWLSAFVASLPTDKVTQVLSNLLTFKLDKYEELLASVAGIVARSNPESIQSIVKLFETYSLHKGLAKVLQPYIIRLNDGYTHFMYVRACIETNNVKEAEKVCRESSAYDPVQVKNYLMESNAADQLPLIIVCDRFNFVPELVAFLYRQNMFKYIEVYAQKVNPKRTPEVVAALLDSGCDESTIQQLLQSSPLQFSIEQLIEQVEVRNRLSILRPLLESQINKNNMDGSISNALAKIYIDSGDNAENYLRTNNVYDPAKIGKYAEKRNPLLALIAFEKGKCSHDFIRLTNENMLFSQQATYLIKSKDLGLWKAVLHDEKHRLKIVEQLISGNSLNASDAEEVSLAVKALISAGLAIELVSVLENLLLMPTAFSRNKYLQNLLILTAIKTCPEKISDFVTRLEDFDGVEVGKAATNASLYEEALMAYKKTGNKPLALEVLFHHIKDVGRAYQFAEQVNEPEVWKALGRAFLQTKMLKESIDAFIKAKDVGDIKSLVNMAKEEKRYEDLVKYLTMAQAVQRDQYVETELAFALAMTNRLDTIKELISRPNFVQISQVADMCYKEKLYQACKIFYQSIPNYTKLAITNVHLKDYNMAVDCAKKANNIKVWAELNRACLEEKEFRLAKICALNIVHLVEELEILVASYEAYGFFDEIINVLEAAVEGDKLSTSVITELGILYSRHAPDKLLRFLNTYLENVNINRIICSLEEARLWAELVHVYIHHEDYDKAINVMIEHPIDTWDHEKLCKAILKCSIPETFLKVVKFYYECHPTFLSALLLHIRAKVDAVKVIQFFQDKQELFLIKEYLQSIQNNNLSIINLTLNNLCLEDYDVEGLMTSVSRSEKFDSAQFIAKLKSHELKEFRLINSQLMKILLQWEKAIELLFTEKCYTKCISLALESKDPQLIERLIHKLVQLDRSDLFMGALYGCMEYVRTEVALEAAWKNSWLNIVMPFICQSLKSVPKDSPRA